MKIPILAAAVLAVSLLSSCKEDIKSADNEITSSVSAVSESGADIDALKEKYPEYFELSDFKGVEVYVWQMAEDSYLCGMMSGTNRNKTDEEITELSQKALEIEEAKAILDYLGVRNTDVIVIPVIQPYSSYQYEIDEAYTEKVKKLFE